MKGRTASRDRSARLARRIAGEVKPFRWPIGGLTLLSVAQVPLTLLRPLPLAIAVDSVIGTKALPGFLRTLVPPGARDSPFKMLMLAAALEVVVVLLLQLQNLFVSVLQISTGERLTLRFQTRLFAHAQRLSFAFHDARGTIDSIYRIQYDAPSIQYIVVFGIISFVASALTLVSMIYVIFRIDSVLGVVALAISPLLFVYARYYALRMRPRYKEAKRLQSTAFGVVQEVLTGFRVVKAFGREEHEARRFTSRADAGVRARIKLAVAEGAFQLIVNMTTAIGTALVLVIGVLSVRSHHLTLGELVVVIGYLALLYNPLEDSSKLVATLQNQIAGAERAFELLDEVPDVAERANARAIVRAKGAVELRDVSFSYDGSENVIEHVSCSVAAGECLGIIGPTGAGKTTLLSLLTRFYDATNGCVLLDGIDVRDYRLRDLRDQFAIMLQEPVLFSTTIADNIAYARPGASFDDIVAASRAAGADAFVMRLTDGYDTMVGERGMRLSGGERQRISLARAFLKDAPILILDEPTSSVDVETEAAIMATMEQLMTGRTTIMISHRHSALEGCDTIIELRDGGIGSPRSPAPAPSSESASPEPSPRWHAVAQRANRCRSASATVGPLIAPLPSTLVLEQALRNVLSTGARFNADAHLAIVHRRQNPYASTFASEIVTCQADDGQRFELFCKYARATEHDDSHITLGSRGGVGYEAAVYSELLAPLATSAAHFYGASDLAGSTCLVLEYVGDADRIDESPHTSAAMLGAARWIGEFHARCEQSPTAPALLRYDADHYRRSIRNAMASCEVFEADNPWLRVLYTRADELVDLLAQNVPVLIHGEYYPHNILYREGRVIPVDWESAAVAPGEIDLMTLTERWDDALEREYCDEYVRARWPAGPPADWESRRLAARAYLQVRFLGDAGSWKHGRDWRLDLLHNASGDLGLLR
jgi:ATP-binding cassette subfamily B protein